MDPAEEVGHAGDITMYSVDSWKGGFYANDGQRECSADSQLWKEDKLARSSKPMKVPMVARSSDMTKLKKCRETFQGSSRLREKGVMVATYSSKPMKVPWGMMVPMRNM